MDGIDVQINYELKYFR